MNKQTKIDDDNQHFRCFAVFNHNFMLLRVDSVTAYTNTCCCMYLHIENKRTDGWTSECVFVYLFKIFRHNFFGCICMRRWHFVAAYLLVYAANRSSVEYMQCYFYPSVYPSRSHSHAITISAHILCILFLFF